MSDQMITNIIEMLKIILLPLIIYGTIGGIVLLVFINVLARVWEVLSTLKGKQ